MATTSEGKHSQTNIENSTLESPTDNGAASVYDDEQIAHYTSQDAHYKSSNRGRLKIIGIVIGAVVVVLAVIYFIFVFVFSGHFYPNTYITLNSNIDASMKTPEEVSALLDDAISNYTVEVVGQGFDTVVTSEQAGLKLDSESIADGIMGNINPWAWPIEIFKTHNETNALKATYNESTDLAGVITAAVDEFNARDDVYMPVDASVTYDEGQACYVVVPQVSGTALDANKVIDAVAEGALNLQPQVAVDESMLLQPNIFEDNGDLIQARDNANAIMQVHLEASLGGTIVGETTPELITSWITIATNLPVAEEVYVEPAEEGEQAATEDYSGQAFADEIDGADEADGAAVEGEEIYDEVVVAEPIVSVVLNEDAVNAWALEVTTQCDTVGTTRTYTRPDGAVITVSGGTYGWYTDTAAFRSEVLDALYAHESGVLEIPTTSTGTAFNGKGERDWGDRYIDIDISAQYVHLYEGEASIWESSCVTGLPTSERATPTGVYSINWSLAGRDVTLVGYKSNGEKDYESFVSYWMPFYGNSVGLHDASWRGSFGGTIYQTNGSHGCVNLPSGNAANLYNIISAYWGETLPVVVHY